MDNRVGIPAGSHSVSRCSGRWLLERPPRGPRGRHLLPRQRADHRRRGGGRPAEPLHQDDRGRWRDRRPDLRQRAPVRSRKLSRQTRTPRNPRVSQGKKIVRPVIRFPQHRSAEPGPFQAELTIAAFSLESPGESAITTHRIFRISGLAIIRFPKTRDFAVKCGFGDDKNLLPDPWLRSLARCLSARVRDVPAGRDAGGEFFVQGLKLRHRRGA